MFASRDTSCLSEDYKQLIEGKLLFLQSNPGVAPWLVQKKPMLRGKSQLHRGCSEVQRANQAPKTAKKWKGQALLRQNFTEIVDLLISESILAGLGLRWLGDHLANEGEDPGNTNVVKIAERQLMLGHELLGALFSSWRMLRG